MNAGLFRLLPNGAVEQFTLADGLPDINISILHEDKNGRIWVGLRPVSVTSGLLLLVAEPRKNQNIVERFYTTKDGLPADWITDLYEASDGKFWVGTINGLCEWQGGKNSVCKTYTKDKGLCSNEFWSIAEDKDKNLWAGTRCGLMKWARYGFTTYIERDGTDTAWGVNSIFENRDGELFASFNRGTTRAVSRFDGERFELVKPRFPPNISYFGWGWKQTVWQDRTGDWWFPTGNGLYRFQKPARFEDLSKSEPQHITVGTQPTEVFRIYEDSRGDIWVSTLVKVFELWHWRRASNTWHNYTAEVNLNKYRIASSFVEDRAGNLWIGTGGDANDAALIRWHEGQFKVFTQAEYPLLAGWLRDLYVDSKNRLWIADTTNGLLRLDDVNADQLNFKRYTPAEGLSSTGVLCITEDEFGRIYIGTGRGLDRLNPETGQIENFTTADGLPNSNIELAYRDRQNNLWFGMTGGLARFKPEPERERQPPNVLITGLRVNGEALSISVLGEKKIAPLELNSDQKQVSVNFLGLGTNLGEHLRYEYRLGESDWTRADERTVNFANLASGNYQFEVRAETADRIYSAPAVVAFRIAAPIWQRWWFVASVLILTMLAIYLFYKNRLKRLLEMERMRTRIATDLHDDIGANLTKISILTEVVQQQFARSTKEENGFGAGGLLENIAETSRESVASMSDIVWAINPKKDSLLDLTRRMRRHAEETLQQRDILLKFDAPAANLDLRLDADTRRNIYLIFKESLNNIVRHAQATAVEINFRTEQNKLFLQITDNGSGFDATQDSDGNGLLNMKKRAAVFGERLQIISACGEGTTIVLCVGLARGFWT